MNEDQCIPFDTDPGSTSPDSGSSGLFSYPGEHFGASHTARSSRRFELKYVITHSMAEQLQAWARRHLEPDAHCDPSLQDSYWVSTLYLDTPQFDAYYGGAGQRKFRLRRYGSEQTIWLETKRRSNSLVRKRRTFVNESDVSRLDRRVDDNWVGDWFHRRIEEKQLRPMAIVHYLRFARISGSLEDPCRLTIDRDLFGQGASGWHVNADRSRGVELLKDRLVLELKFNAKLPVLFQRMLFEFSLQPAAFSKYRTSVNSCGLEISRATCDG